MYTPLSERCSQSRVFVSHSHMNHIDNTVRIILPLENIFYHRCVLMIYKCHTNFLLSSISLLYAKNVSIHDHNTRCNNLLRVAIGYKSFTSVSARIWNVLKNIIEFDVLMSKFKSLLKQNLLYNSLTLTYSK